MDPFTNDRPVAPPTTSRSLLPLLIAGTLGRLPNVTLPLASLLLVADRSDLTRGGLASGAVSLGIGGIGVFVGRHLDSDRAGRVLMLLALAHFPAIAAFVALAGHGSIVILALVAFVAGVTMPPVGPVVRALLAERAAPSEIQRVFAWDSMSVEASWIGGPLLVSLAILISGPVAAVAMSPVLAAVGVTAVVRQPPRRITEASGGGRWLTAPVVRLILAFACAGTAFRAVTIAVTEVARGTGHDELSGPIIAFWASGSLLGAWIVSRRGLRSVPRLGAVLAVLVGLIGLGQSSVWLTAVLAFLSGIPTAPFIGGLNALTSKVAAESAHVRAFSAMQAASTVMAALGAAVGGAAIDRYGPASISIPAAILLGVSARLAVVDTKNPVGARLALRRRVGSDPGR